MWCLRRAQCKSSRKKGCVQLSVAGHPDRNVRVSTVISRHRPRLRTLAKMEPVKGLPALTRTRESDVVN